MRTLCDVCEAAAAKVFCAADEAALCLACDDKIHGCNKLASRHVRLELAESRAVPKCDICESAPAFFYCAVDGTSLCLQCDLEVHIGGKKTHERYLLMAQRVELPKTATKGEGQAQGNGLERGHPLINGAHPAGGTPPPEGGAPGAGPDRRGGGGNPPSSTAATAPGRDSLAGAGAKERGAPAVHQRSVAKAESDAPAVAIAVGDEVEGAMAVEGGAPGEGAGGDGARESPERMRMGMGGEGGGRGGRGAGAGVGVGPGSGTGRGIVTAGADTGAGARTGAGMSTGVGTGGGGVFPMDGREGPGGGSGAEGLERRGEETPRRGGGQEAKGRDAPSLDLNSKPKRSPQVPHAGVVAQGSEELGQQMSRDFLGNNTSK